MNAPPTSDVPSCCPGHAEWNARTAAPLPRLARLADAGSNNGKRSSTVENTTDTGAGGELHQTTQAPEQRLATNHGVAIGDDQNSLEAGPTLPEDFVSGAYGAAADGGEGRWQRASIRMFSGKPARGDDPDPCRYGPRVGHHRGH